MEHWYLFLLAGLLAGIVSSLFGVGAGIVMVPLLTLGFAFGQKSAQGTALMVMIPMVIVGALRYKLNPDIEINMTVSGFMAIGGVVGAIIGSQLVFNISPIVLKRMFGVFIILAGINILLKTRKSSVAAPPSVELLTGEDRDRA
ncbi:MAG: sulfite exporter TauE/SafE family protein [Kiritimatiellaceae bacterium]|nr:sulfite exporter TauE/SafE family protein [Kiritimatiellaceae bacterium]